MFVAELQPSVPVLKDKFELLVKNQFLMHSLYTDTAEVIVNDKPNFNLPDINVAAITNQIQGNTCDLGDSNIYWKLNFDRFTQDLR